MDQNLIKEGILKFWVFLFIGIITLLIMRWFFHQLKLKKRNIDEFSSANGIFLAGIILSVFYLMSSVITPLTATMKLLNDTSSKWTYTFEVLKYSSLFVIIVFVSAFITCVIAYQIVKRSFKNINVLEEINKNNIGLSLMAAIIIICFSVLIKDSIQPVLDSFVPYPEMPNLLK
ncbi:hypothetical protein [uncultured Winogradskyella sp.]|uniref:DUF350 domain-containing protein n=1 Tax=uncultured Winogradskyella sp. TaxID=395353 RepID=UPI003513E91B